MHQRPSNNALALSPCQHARTSLGKARNVSAALGMVSVSVTYASALENVLGKRLGIAWGMQ